MIFDCTLKWLWT